MRKGVSRSRQRPTSGRGRGTSSDLTRKVSIRTPIATVNPISVRKEVEDVLEEERPDPEGGEEREDHSADQHEPYGRPAGDLRLDLYKSKL
jgi:hypothetical protein